MKRKFNWRDYDDYSEWLHDILETLTDNNKEKDKANIKKYMVINGNF